MSDFSRPPGFRFNFLGVNTRSQPDALPPGKYSYAQNVRGVSNNSVRTRPGYTAMFSTGAFAITDIRAYAALGTDDDPRLLARDAQDNIYLDDGAKVGSLKPDSGASNFGDGTFMIPYRPNASPEPWMYIGSGTDYQKFSAPDANNNVIQQKVGLIEPQAPPDAVPDAFYYQDFTGSEASDSWEEGGTAGTPSDGGPTDTVAAIFVDPASTGVTPRYSVQVAGTIPYRPGMCLTIGADPVTHGVQDVLPAINTSAGLTVLAIRYYAGVTGRCVVVTDRIPVAGSVPTFSQGSPSAASIFGTDFISGLRRGSLIQFSGGSEICFVLSVSTGPGGNLCFEVSTTGTHTPTETLTGIPAITLSNVTAAIIGQTITAKDVESTLTGAGTGTLSQVLSTNPFNTAFNFAATPPATAQDQDFLSFLINIDNLANFISGTITFDVNQGGVTYVDNAYYYDFDLSSLLNVSTLDLLTGLYVTPSNLWYQVRIPISSLVRIGTDDTRTLANVAAVRLTILTSGNVTVKISSLLIGGGSDPDVGDNGSPYFYLIRPRSSLTGVLGNPSPVTRYGVSPRRQRVIVLLPITYPDPQMDTWDIFRYGGSVTSFRYIGSCALAAAVFFDNYFDTAALAGAAIDYTNFEPWPTIDLPYNVTPGAVNGVTTTVTVTGTVLVIDMSQGGPFAANPFPPNILRWLPGTLVIVGGQQAYTLWNRPTISIVSSSHYRCVMQFVENIGNPASPSVYVQEPAVANQHLPYLWGPNASGDIFGCGDPLRPGTFSYIQSNNPDSAPDSYNQEITNPSEPLMGGELQDGVSFVASTKRWWRLYPNFAAAPRYQAVEIPVGRGLAAPYAHCSDGKQIFFVAKDGVWSTTQGSLTDEDLYNLFPHEGVAGKNVTSNGWTFYAPDYTRAAQFRLAYCNSYLYFDYQDINGSVQTLVLDTRTMAWCPDVYNDPVRVHYAIEQQEGTVLSDTALYPVLVLGDSNGNAWRQKDFTNDGGAGITGVISTPEFDAGDLRASEQWGDMMLDCVPAAEEAAVVVTPVSGGAQASPPITLVQAATRTQNIISLAGGILKRYLGMLITWEDDFTSQSVPTSLLIWQPSYVSKPETIADRAGDWDDCGTPDAKYFQGFELHADTFNQPKRLLIQDADTQVLHAIQPTQLQHNGEQTIAYSFVTPFIAHLVRDVPQDQVPWRRFGFKWVFEPTPESVQTWQTQGTAFGLKGYSHIKGILAAYASTAPVVLTITVFDGTAPIPVVLPATGGAYQKAFFPLTFNKGLLYFFNAVSAAPWQPYLTDWEIQVGQWGRAGEYLKFKNIGDPHGDQARL